MFHVSIQLAAKHLLATISWTLIGSNITNRNGTYPDDGHSFLRLDRLLFSLNNTVDSFFCHPITVDSFFSCFVIFLEGRVPAQFFFFDRRRIVLLFFYFFLVSFYPVSDRLFFLTTDGFFSFSTGRKRCSSLQPRAPRVKPTPSPPRSVRCRIPFRPSPSSPSGWSGFQRLAWLR